MANQKPTVMDSGDSAQCSSYLVSMTNDWPHQRAAQEDALNKVAHTLGGHLTGLEDMCKEKVGTFGLFAWVLGVVGLIALSGALVIRAPRTPTPSPAAPGE